MLKDNYTTVNIRDYLLNNHSEIAGEQMLINLFSGFSCTLNPNVEKFLKENAINFTKMPPHITISAFETQDEAAAIESLERAVARLRQGTLEWVSVGEFFPYVIFLIPVLNEYLHEMSIIVNDELSNTNGMKISPYYRPLQWLPHTTIAKKLSKDEIKMGTW